MDDLPLEIKKIIISFLNDNEKRQIRLVNLYWFNVVDYTNFTIYLARKTEWKQIVDRFEKYAKPISLSLTKSIMTDMTDLLEHLTRLTNLMSFVFGEERDQTNYNAEANDWSRMSAMTSLRHIKGLYMPAKAWKQLTQLEVLDLLSENDPMSLSDRMDVAKTLTNLHTIALHLKGTVNPFECITDAHSKLTNLEFLFGNNVEPTSEKDLQRLARIKRFSFTVGEYYRIPRAEVKPFSLKYMTALEDLKTNSAIESVTSTNLRELELRSVREAEKDIISRMNGLTSFRGMELHANTDYLKALTNLESFSTLWVERDTEGIISILGSLESTRLTHLSIEYGFEHIDFGYLTQLQSIADLNLDEVYNLSTSQLMVLTNLTSFVITNNGQCNDGLLITAVPSLTKLRHVMFHPGEIDRDILVDFSPLTDLEHLSLQTNCVTGLEHCTNLTALIISVGRSNEFYNFSFLACLTNMQHLKISYVNSNAGQYVSTMTNLNSLQIFRFESEEQVKSLTVLTRLTMLSTVRPNGNEIDRHVAKLTALQELALCEASEEVIQLIKSSLPNLRKTHRYSKV